MIDLYFKEIIVCNEDNTTKVVLHWDCFEGVDGDYDPSDLSDRPLLRFDVYSRNPAYQDEGNDGWRIPDSSSYCTAMDARKDRRKLTAAAKGILEAVDEYCQRGAGIKKLCEELSWWE